jgi:hypothetical protein
MQGLSFREYLMLFHHIELHPYSLDQIVNHQVDVPQIPHPLPFFDNYLKKGYYPFAREDDFGLKLQQVVNQTLEVDIPTYAQMNVSTGRKLKQLLAIVAQSVPFKPNMTKIAEIEHDPSASHRGMIIFHAKIPSDLKKSNYKQMTC